jgi:hypothetical protein
VGGAFVATLVTGIALPAGLDVLDIAKANS